MNNEHQPAGLIEVNGLELYTEVWGPEDGELLFLLHGFPEFSFGWKKQAQMLADQGYRVAVPNLRGYYNSSKPEKINGYTLEEIAKDLIALVHFFHREQAIMIGHDWGGIAGWFLASSYPDYVKKLIILNVPHPAVFARVAPFYPPQWLRSSYILFFQLPILPEILLKQNHYRLLKKMMKTTARPGTFPPEILDAYQKAWEKEGALTGMLNWYRAIRRQPFFTVPAPDPAVPVRMIWGRNDAALSLKLAKESMKSCGNGELVLIDEATHWLHHEYPDIVNYWLVRFIEKE
nr:alpha/beta fold hydrolase [Domibacillus indicus]